MQKIEKEIQEKYNSKVGLEIQSSTWLRHCRQLFDYESDELHVQSHFVRGSCSVFRLGSFYRLPVDDKTYLQNIDNSELLVTIQETLNQYTIFPSEGPQDDKVYLVISRFMENGLKKGYKLQINDVLKFGRAEFRVIETRNSNGFIRAANQLSKASIAYQEECLFCCGNENTAEDPLLRPCEFTENCPIIHLNCLRQWSQKKLVKNSENVESICFNLKCSVCQRSLPPKIQINNKELDILQFQRPDKPYIILKNLDQKDHTLIHIINFGQTVKFGRGQDSDVRLSDISISNNHASINYDGTDFILIDNKSKFGTLVQLQTPYQISEDRIVIQIGRTVLTINIQPFTTTGLSQSTDDYQQFKEFNQSQYD